MHRKSKASLQRRAEVLREKIQQRTLAFGGGMLALTTVGRGLSASGEMPVALMLLVGTSCVAFFWLRRRWMHDYREALGDAGVDPDRDELVERSEGMKNTLLVLFGVFGGMGAILAVLIWLLRR